MDCLFRSNPFKQSSAQSKIHSSRRGMLHSGAAKRFTLPLPASCNPIWDTRNCKDPA